MFNIGGMEILVIMVVALLVLGPEKLPGVMRTVGKALGELRKATTDFQRTMNAEITAGEKDTPLYSETPPGGIGTLAEPEEAAEAVPMPEEAAAFAPESEETAEAVPEPAPAARPGRKRPSPRIARKRREQLPEPEATDPPETTDPEDA